MKLKNYLTAALLALPLLVTSNGTFAADSGNSNSTTAQAANQVTFTVKKYDLVGFVGPDYINPVVRAEIVSLLNQYVGTNITPAKINELRDKIQTVLNAKAKGIFAVNVPRQVIKDGVVVLNVNFVASRIVWGHAPDYSEENVKNSLPSLRQGVQFVAGRPFVSERELTMASENPLKLTQIQYDLSPGQPVTTYVNVYAPQGDHVSFFQLDNNGPENLNYIRGTLAYLNGNLTGHDDVLQLVFVSNFKSIKDFYALQGFYSYPFYDQHQKLSFKLGHATTKINNYSVAGGSLSISATGAGTYGGVDWAYYLPHYNFGYSNQLKLVAGFNWSRNQQGVSSFGQTVSSSNYQLTTYYFGINGKVVPVQGHSLAFGLNYNFFDAGHLGTSEFSVINPPLQNRDGIHQFEWWLTGNLSYSRPVGETGWSWNTSVGAQYTPLRLFKGVTFGINMRDRSGQGGGGGDIGAWINTQITTPQVNLIKDVGLNFFGFFDGGIVHYYKPVDKNGLSNATYQYAPPQLAHDHPQYTKTSASIGGGLNISYGNLSGNAYTSYLLDGFNKADANFGDKQRFSFFLSGSVRF